MTTTTSASGLIIEDLVEGTGETATAGQTVSVHYTGWLVDGSKFDSSKDRDERPSIFRSAAGASSPAGTKACRA